MGSEMCIRDREYAIRYLSSQTWIQRNSVERLSGGLKCVPLAAPGRSAVEVKTRWDDCRVHLSARQLSRLLDPEDDYMLFAVVEARNLFESPPRPPQLRIVHTPPRPALPTRAASTSKSAQRRAPLPASAARGVADQAEGLIDGVLDSGAARMLPSHIVEYVHKVGLAALRRQWPPNRKASAKLMLVEAGSARRASEASRDRASSHLAVQLAIEQLLRLAALVGWRGSDAGSEQPKVQHGQRAVLPTFAAPMELCIASCACLACSADADDLSCMKCPM